MTGIEETYLRAVTTKSLQTGRAALDVVGAAGMTRETLGLQLVRLRGEFDRVRSEQRQAIQLLADLGARVAAMQRAAKDQSGRMQFGPTTAARHQRDAAAMAVTIEKLARAAWLVAANRMPSLPTTQTAVASLCQQLVERLEHPANCQMLAASVLRWWLDPVCPSCSGTGSVGAFGSPRTTCPLCKGARTKPLHRGDDQLLAIGLLSTIERKADEAMTRLHQTYRGTIR